MASWSGQLDAAKSVSEVVALTRDHFARWSPEEIALLPDNCRPSRFRDDVDVEELHRRAVEEFRNTRASGDELAQLQKLMAFIARASVEIARLRRSEEPLDNGPATRPPKRSASVRDP
jgi:hypothetical protein